MMGGDVYFHLGGGGGDLLIILTGPGPCAPPLTLGSGTLVCDTSTQIGNFKTQWTKFIQFDTQNHQSNSKKVSNIFVLCLRDFLC